MLNRITLEAVPNMPLINSGDNVAHVIVDAAHTSDFHFQDRDILCVASKAVSIAEGRIRSLATVNVTDIARRIQERIPRKDPRVIQVIIDETGQPDGSRVELDTNYIAGWLPNGYRLTSAGVDKESTESVILLPEDPDKSATMIGRQLRQATGVRVGVLITDSDGRVEKAGATQIAIGVYGVPALRVTQSTSGDGKTSSAEETICDMMAAAAGLIMGQRGTNKPVVVIRGYEYQFSETSSIRDALSRPS